MKLKKICNYCKKEFITSKKEAKYCCRECADLYKRKTNDYIIGVGFTGMMDSDAIHYGLEVLENDCVAEALIHPCKYSTSVQNSHTKEFEITQDMQLKATISRLGFDLANYKNLD